MVDTTTLEGIAAASAAQPGGLAADTAEMADLIAIVLALKSIDENLQKAYDAYVAKNKAQFIAYVKASKFYQNYNSTARQRAIAQKEQPGVWQQDKDKFVEEQKQRIITALGAKAWNATVQKQVEDAYALGFTNSSRDNNLLDKLISSAINFKTVGGAAVTSIDDLKQFASQYGVLDMYNDTYWNDKSEKLFKGEITAADIQSDIKSMAAQTYPAWAKGFSAGQSLDAQTGYVINTVSKITGLPTSALKVSDPMIAPWLQYKDPKTGEFTQPPQYLVEQGTKEKFFDLYAKTPAGTAYLDGLTLKVLQDMGLM